MAIDPDDIIGDGSVIKSIPYYRLKNREFLAKGGFGIVEKAILTQNSGENIDVALKILHNSEDVTKNILKELISHRIVNTESFIIKCLGVTRDLDKDEYIIILEYATDGSLHKFLSENYRKITWQDRIEKLYYIATGFEQIHMKGLIHCDIHSGNILLGVNGIFGSIRIADLGLCRETLPTESEKIYGVLPYLAPEILKGYPYTQASDVYSFGILMWEFTSGRRPFENRPNDQDLVIEIINGMRPDITEDTPLPFSNLMKKCWSPSPSDRPTMNDIKQQYDEWFWNKKDKNEFGRSEELRKYLIETNKLQGHGGYIHPDTCYISRPLNHVTESSKVIGSALNNLRIN